jgi:hypothetical protein
MASPSLESNGFFGAAFPESKSETNREALDLLGFHNRQKRLFIRAHRI